MSVVKKSKSIGHIFSNALALNYPTQHEIIN